MYQKPDQNSWTGRIDSLDDPRSFRFHQFVKCTDINHMNKNENAFGIIGFECDEGVKRNKGRLGAAKAPNKIKKMLAPLPYNIGESKTIDVGNVVCDNEKLEQHQKELGYYVTELIQQSKIPIILGGGHETLYGHYLGVREAVESDASVGVINIDAHFDLRDDHVTSSGTMFHQIMNQDDKAGYLCLGVQTFSNTRKLFDTAEELDVIYILEENIGENNLQETFDTIDTFSKKHDYIMLTLDMDSIASSAAPGVSAPSPLGMDPKVVRALLRYIVSQNNITSFDVSEVNPLVDENDKTVRLA